MSLSTLEKQIIEFLNLNPNRAYTIDQIATHFDKGSLKSYKKIVKALNFLEHAGKIKVTHNYKFQASQASIDSVEGIFRANSKGYGFIQYDENEPDLFVPPTQTGAAMHGDTVKAKIIKHADPNTQKGSEAKVIEIIERATKQLVGEFVAYNAVQREETGYIGYVLPKGDFTQEVRIDILPDGLQSVSGMMCIVKIKQYPTLEHSNRLVGLIAKEIGHKDAPGVDILSVLFQLNIPHVFPENVLEEANEISDTISAEDLVGRKDLRQELIITIDGADAKDLDDAISLAKNADGSYQLGVHIADVSHYVKEGSLLDREAYQRGTSVYLTDRVVPMLPQRLSNGICSLHPNEDRLTLTCEMTINQKGNVTAYHIYPSVINSSYRMTYDDVNAILNGDDVLSREYSEITSMLFEMEELHIILAQLREKRGALDFEAPEAKIKVDEKGHPIKIELRNRATAEKLIESFMLCANETVAYDYTRKELPFMYRIHEQPEEERMMRLAEFVTMFGMVLRGNVATIEPRQLQQALKAIKGESYEHVVSTMMLRSMQQAKYANTPTGHYGLAAEDYTHFTSPIRRYPDLIVHRLIHRYLLTTPTATQQEQLDEKLPEIAEHASKMERRAIDAERQVEAMKKAEYMQDKIGEEFDGTITSVTSFGFFVGLDNTVEGLVSIQSLKDDYYEFVQHYLALVGKRTQHTYRIGQKVRIRVEKVNIEEKTIDFEIVEAYEMPNVLPISLKNKSSKGKSSNKRQAKSATHTHKKGNERKSKQKYSRNKSQKST